MDESQELVMQTLRLDISDLHAFFLHALSPNREDEGVTAKKLLCKTKYNVCRFNYDKVNK